MARGSTVERRKGADVRDISDVGAQRSAVVGYESTASGTEFGHFLAGARAGLEWAMRAATTAPLSGIRATATEQWITHEVQLCEEVLGGRVVPQHADIHFVNGVEHALSWVLELELEPPVPSIPVPASTAS